MFAVNSFSKLQGFAVFTQRFLFRPESVSLKSPSPLRSTLFLPALLCLTVLTACGGGGGDSTPPSVATNTPTGAAAAVRTASVVQICPGQSADPTGETPASTAIQACVDQIGANGTLELPPGTYLMSSQLKVMFPFTLKTKGLSGSTATCTDGVECATLKASPLFAEKFGILLVGGEGLRVERFVMDHVTLDGNRAARLTGAARDQCVAGNNRYGFNATIENCSSCKVAYSASVNAVCGTAMAWNGNAAVIERNIFANNGENDAPSLWADGLSVVQADDSVIQENRFVDNSDVGFISFGSARTKIVNNVVTQAKAKAFAGFMLDSLVTGDFSDTQVSGNTVNCSPDKCFFAVNIGPAPWYPKNKPVFGGRFEGNTISGGTIGLNISGTAASPQMMYVGGNMLVGLYPAEKTACRSVGSVSSAAMSRDPNIANAAIALGDNYLNQQTVFPVLQSTDNCIN